MASFLKKEIRERPESCRCLPPRQAAALFSKRRGELVSHARELSEECSGKLRGFYYNSREMKELLKKQGTSVPTSKEIKKLYGEEFFLNDSALHNVLKMSAAQRITVESRDVSAPEEKLIFRSTLADIVAVHNVVLSNTVRNSLQTHMGGICENMESYPEVAVEAPGIRSKIKGAAMWVFGFTVVVSAFTYLSGASGSMRTIVPILGFVAGAIVGTYDAAKQFFSEKALLGTVLNDVSEKQSDLERLGFAAKEIMRKTEVMQKNLFRAIEKLADAPEPSVSPREDGDSQA